MSKIFKRVTAAAMASVIALSLAVSANAAGEECKHPILVRRRTGCSNYYNYTHTIRVYGEGGEKTETCIVSGFVYEYSYVCTSCNKLVKPAGTETEETHNNPLCGGNHS